MPRIFLWMVALTVLLGAAPPFDPKPWLEDYRQLRAQMAVAYANLDDAAARGVDLPALDQTTQEALKRAGSEVEALAVLQRFIAVFQDNHLQLALRGHVLFDTSPFYDVHLREDGDRVVLAAPLPGGCALERGARVERVNGRPVAEWIAELEPLAPEPEATWRRNMALTYLTQGPFAPRGGLTVEGRSEAGQALSCRVESVPLSTRFTSKGPAVPLSFELTGEAACAAMGAKARPPGPPYEGEPVPGFERLETPSNAFPAGLLSIGPGKRWGVVRIPLFSAEAYPAACAEAWDAWRQGKEGLCEGECRWDFEEEAIAPRLLADLAARVRQLQAAQVEGVVLDLMGNGGGTDWVEPATRLFGPKGMPCSGLGFIRHPHWTKQFEDMKAELDADLARPGLSPQDRRILTQARQRVLDLRGKTRRTCSRERVWTHKGAPQACPGVARRGAPACGLVPDLPPEALSGLGSRQLVQGTAAWHDTEGLYTGPLVVLTNRRTASAAEQAAALLKDGAGARLLGERTLGSGCGYTNGGLPVVLTHSKLRVNMPDCIRYRRDGTNEQQGLQPDIAVVWGALDSPGERARRWMEALRASLASP
ncbi:Peptidase family S41 [Stigmatella aurantiaca]|uniref:Peptidase family S41 n=1 Tax=Stigmatella aurantiaca TaxID=41 RepID=A0A1H7Y950_STIAU|nr:S41 family peptidase [Stigmatella aurantiaca]SEM42475.1 Peptidase family S41 [Stigmatella aurantiaca]